MPYPVKIQPIDFNAAEELRRKFETVPKPILSKSRFKRLFERQFSRNSVPEKHAGATEPLRRDGSDEFEPSSVCLERMVQNYIEETNEKQLQKCGRNRCNCFNGNGTDSSDDELDSYNSSSTDACDILKSIAPCSSVSERNLLADIAKIVECNQIRKRKDGFCSKIVADGLVALGYNASVCKSQWEKSPSFPAGMYEYVDVIHEGERLIIDIDFRSEFEIARSSKAYKQILQSLPSIFVGKTDRLESIISIVSEAAKQSLMKKGMPFPPWRKAEYVKAKWLSPSTRTNPVSTGAKNQEKTLAEKDSSSDGEFELLFCEEDTDNGGYVVSSASNTCSSSSSPSEKNDGGVKEWDLPEIRPKSDLKGVKVMTGLASVIEGNT